MRQRNLAAAFAVLVAGMAISAVPFFQGRVFDANELVLSNLLSRSENPHGYAAAALGTVLCAMLLRGAPHGWIFRAGLVAMAAVGVLAPVEEMYGQPHILLAFAAFILVSAGLAWRLHIAAKQTGSAVLRGLAIVAWIVLAFLIYLLVTPDFFHGRTGWRSLAACEWALCGWVAVQQTVLGRFQHATIEGS